MNMLKRTDNLPRYDGQNLTGDELFRLFNGGEEQKVSSDQLIDIFSALRSPRVLGVQLIQSESDLPDPKNGKIQLENNVAYLFHGFITTPHTVVLAANSPILGWHGGVSGLIHTGGSTTIKGSECNFFCRNISISAPGGQIFDISGTISEEILVESVSFSDPANLGNIADLGVIDGFRVPSFKGVNFEQFDSGLTFSGNDNVPDKIFFTNSPMRNVSASGVTLLTFAGAIGPEAVDISSGYIKGVQSDTEVIRVESGASPSEKFLYRGMTHDATVNKDNILNGEAAVTAVGYKVSDSPPLRDSSAIAEFNLDSSTGTTISNIGEFVRVSGAGSIGNETERFQEISDGQFEYIGRDRTNVMVIISASINGQNGDRYSIAVAKNDTVEPTSATTVEVANDTSIVTSSIEDIVNGDTLSVHVANEDGTANVTFNDYSFNVAGI